MNGSNSATMSAHIAQRGHDAVQERRTVRLGQSMILTTANLDAFRLRLKSRNDAACGSQSVGHTASTIKRNNRLVDDGGALPLTPMADESIVELPRRILSSAHTIFEISRRVRR